MKQLSNIAAIFLLGMYGGTTRAQNALRVHYKDGTEQNILISDIDSVSFVDYEAEEPQQPASIVGSWFWADDAADYDELITFNADRSYSSSDHFYTNGMTNTTFGWYGLYGSMLTFEPGSIGYFTPRIIRWLVQRLTDNELEVVAPLGTYTYYRVQNDFIHLPVDGSYLLDEQCDVVYADGLVVKAVGNRLYGMDRGTAYILVQSLPDQTIRAYQVIVE